MNSRNHKVLIVEDNAMDISIAKALVSIFVPENAVDLVRTAEDAINLCRRNDYSIILADYFLEGRLTGSDLFNFCENLENETHFIFMTSLNAFGISQIFPSPRNRQFGHLQKPYRISQAGQLIRNLLD